MTRDQGWPAQRRGVWGAPEGWLPLLLLARIPAARELRPLRDAPLSSLLTLFFTTSHRSSGVLCLAISSQLCVCLLPATAPCCVALLGWRRVSTEAAEAASSDARLTAAAAGADARSPPSGATLGCKHMLPAPLRALGATCCRCRARTTACCLPLLLRRSVDGPIRTVVGAVQCGAL